MALSGAEKRNKIAIHYGAGMSLLRSTFQNGKISGKRYNVLLYL